MQQQKSFKEEGMGVLYLVPTPIGNLEDMTFRAIQTLKDVDFIAAEDTRQTKKLCNHFEIPTPLFSYHEHNKEGSGHKVLMYLREGKKIALVSDAGTPTISDPGYELVVDALEEGFSVIPLTGANAAITALIASGLATQPFYYFGFLARDKKEKKKQLETLKRQQATMIFYEAPHRLKETLKAMLDILGNRRVTLARELTKRYEEFIRGTIEEALQWGEVSEIRGEFVLVVEAAGEIESLDEVAWWTKLSIEEHVQYYMDEKNLPQKEALKATAKDRGLGKRDIYKAYHELE